MTERFAGRLARTFGGFDRTHAELPDWEDGGGGEYRTAVQTDGHWEQEPTRFPTVRHGYDCEAVDQHVDALERELAGLRDRVPSADAISAEIARIGEQTAAILQVAHESAHETRRDAQAEADRCLADAAANALAITDEAQQRLRQLDSETDQVWRERGRLIEDVRAVATALFSVADDAAGRFPPEHEKPRASRHPAPLPAPVSAGDDADNGYAGLA